MKRRKFIIISMLLAAISTLLKDLPGYHDHDTQEDKIRESPGHILYIREEGDR